MFDWPSNLLSVVDGATDVVRRLLQLAPFAARLSSPSGDSAFDGGIDRFDGVVAVLRVGGAVRVCRTPRRQKKACEMSERGKNKTIITDNFSTTPSIN